MKHKETLAYKQQDSRDRQWLHFNGKHVEEYLVDCLTTFISHIHLLTTAARNGTLGTWRGAFCHCGLWYQKNSNFLTSSRKRPRNDVGIQGDTRQIEDLRQRSTVILNSFVPIWKKQRNDKAWTPLTIRLKMLEECSRLRKMRSKLPVGRTSEWTN